MFDDTELGLIYSLVNSSIKIDLDPTTSKPRDTLEQTFVNNCKQIICEKIRDRLNPNTSAEPRPPTFRELPKGLESIIGLVVDAIDEINKRGVKRSET